MPKEVNGFECERCLTFYGDRLDAVGCEQSHPEPSSLRLTGAGFRQLKGLYGPDRGAAQRFPQRVKINISDKYGDFATYKLEHIGPVGV